MANSKIKSILNGLNYNFSLQSITNSELRVFKYLGYNANVMTPCDFIQILLEILGQNHEIIENKVLYLISIKFLEFFYLQREEIYSSLFKSFTGVEKSQKK